MDQTCPIQKGRTCTKHCPLATRAYPDLPLDAGYECAIKLIPGALFGLADISNSLDEVAAAIDRLAKAAGGAH